MKILLLVIDGFGLGAFPDALNRAVELYGKIIKNAKLPTFAKLGIHSINNPRTRLATIGSYANLKSMSAGSDVVTLYFELAGLHIKNTYPTYPKGLPEEVIDMLERELQCNILGNIVADGSRVINDLGALHYNTGFPIIYTSSRSVMYIAAHEGIMPLNKLYDLCKRVRELMQGKHNVARIMASPFNGTINSFSFTDNNKCYTVAPPAPTMMDVMQMRGIDVISVGKISEVFNGQGITRSFESRSNEKIFDEIKRIMRSSEDGFIFANIEAADMSRNDDINVYTKCLEDIDRMLGEVLPLMNPDDLLILSSNHSYETFNVQEPESSSYMIPLVMYGGRIKPGINLKTVDGLYSVAHTILDYYGFKGMNKSILSEVIKDSK